jgi:hypothetical protein
MAQLPPPPGGTTAAATPAAATVPPVQQPTFVPVATGIDMKAYLSQYKIITGKPVGLPQWLVELAENNGNVLTLQVVELSEMRLSKTKEWALSIFTVEVDNKRASVMLPMGAALTESAVSVEMTTSKDGNKLFNLKFIWQNNTWRSSETITEAEIKARFN